MRWGVIGTRGFAAYACAPAFAQARNAQLVAVLSSDLARARSYACEQGLSAATADLGEFLRTPGLEAVWIASPTGMHFEHAAAALRAGKHVLSEKLLGLSARQAWELVALARDAGRLLATGYQARYVPGHERMRRLIEEEVIGEITVARTYYGLHRPGPPPEWRRRRGTARWGALADLGTHHVDLLRMLLGEVADAHGLDVRQLGFETDDAVAAALRMECGALASLAVTTNVWTETTRVEVYGTEGALIAVDTSPRGQGSVTLMRADRAPCDVTGERPLSWTAELETVTRAAAGDAVGYATGEDGARNLEILEQIV